MLIGFFAFFGFLSFAVCSNSEVIGPSETQKDHIIDNAEPHPLSSPPVQDYHKTSVMQTISSSSVMTSDFSNCLIFAVADNLKHHLTADNVKPVTVLLQHSIQTCPGLNSTFEVFQKIMGFRGLDFAGVMNFISSLKVHNGTMPSHEVEDVEEQVDSLDETQIPESSQDKEDIEIVKEEVVVNHDNSNVSENMPSKSVESVVQNASENDDDYQSEEIPEKIVEKENANIGENYEDAIPLSTENENEDEAPLSSDVEDHKAEYYKFWKEELMNNIREAEQAMN